MTGRGAVKQVGNTGRRQPAISIFRGCVRRCLRIGLPAAAAVLLLDDPMTAADGVRMGLSLCVKSVIPSLFPFLVLAPMLMDALRRMIARLSCGGRTAALLSAFAVGMTAGFPIGAVTLASLCARGILTEEDAARFLGVCTGASPAFLIGYFGQALWSSTAIGWCAWGIQCAVCLVGFLYLLLRLGTGTVSTGRVAGVRTQEESAVSLSAALREAVPRIAQICGAVVFFSVLRAFLCRFAADGLGAVAGGFAEMTGGLRECAALYESGELDKSTALLLSAAMIGCGGVCVGMQTADAASGVGIPMQYYWRQRAVLGAVSALTAGLLLMLGA